MPLINCPECSREISDKAEACPHCGYPIAKFAIAQTSEPPQSAFPEAVDCLDCHKPVPFNDEVCPHCGLFNSQKYKYLHPEEPEELKSHDHGVVVCPRCHSSNISAGGQGFGLGKAAVGGVLLGPLGLLGGLLGSKKTVITCLKCGHKWTPGA